MIDYSKYTLQELKEAWEGVDDNSWPQRAVEIYQRMKDLEEQERLQEAKIPTWILFVEQLFAYSRHHVVLGTDEDRLTYELERKEQRVKKLISAQNTSLSH